MSVSNRYILNQIPVIGALCKTALKAAIPTKKVAGQGATAGPMIIDNLPPRPDDMINDYIRHVGGELAPYQRTVPPHYFPQWSFPSLNESLRGLPYPMAKAVNGGCSLQIGGVIERGEPLVVQAKLVDVDDNGYRAILKTELVTSTAQTQRAIVAHMYTIIPYKRKPEGSPKKPRPTVPEDAQLVTSWQLSDKAGLNFARLTGDFNPIHWVPAYAKASGFKNTILHGFSTMARSYESLRKAGLFQGLAGSTFDVKFTSPLVLPRPVSLFIHNDKDIYVGDESGSAAYMTGSFTQPKAD